MTSTSAHASGALVLFLCSGNYYRSRFAEILFNHLAHAADSPWRADSRGLALTPANVGPISSYALDRLDRLGIAAEKEAIMRCPQEAVLSDFFGATHIVAVKEPEHRPLMQRHFPDWVDRVEYWMVHDIDAATPHDALPELEQLVRALFDRLQEQSK